MLYLFLAIQGGDTLKRRFKIKIPKKAMWSALVTFAILVPIVASVMFPMFATTWKQLQSFPIVSFNSSMRNFARTRDSLIPLGLEQTYENVTARIDFVGVQGNRVDIYLSIRGTSNRGVGIGCAEGGGWPRGFVGLGVYQPNDEGLVHAIVYFDQRPPNFILLFGSRWRFLLPLDELVLH